MPNVTWTFEGDTADLEKALALVQGEASKTDAEVTQAGKSGTAAFGGMEVSSQKAAKVVGGVLVAGLAAATAAAVGLAKATVDFSARMDDAAKTAKKVGGTAEDVQKLRGAFSLAGVDAGVLDGALKKLRVNLGKAKDGTLAQVEALDKLGLSAEDLERLPLPERLAVMADRLRGLSSESDRALVAQDLLGGAGRELVAALEDGGDALRSSIDLIEKHGVVSNEAAAEAEKLQDSIALASQTFRHLKDQILIPLVPAMTSVADAVAQTLLSMETGRLVAFANTLADVTEGAILAARAIGLFAEAQGDSARVAAQDEIAAFAERVSDAKDAVEDNARAIEAEEHRLRQLQAAAADTSEATDGLSAAFQRFQKNQLDGGALEATEARLAELRAQQESLTDEWERSREAFLRLKGELGGEAGLGGAPSVPRVSAPSGGGAGAPAAAGGGPAGASPEAATDAVAEYAEAWKLVQDAANAARKATKKVLDSQLSDSEKLIQAKEEEEARIIELVNNAVSNEMLGADEKLAIIQEGHAARLVLEAQLYEDLEALRQEDLEAERAAAEERVTIWEGFQEAWADGLGQVVNAVGQAASEIVGIFSDMAGEAMDERVKAAKATRNSIEDIEKKLAETTDEVEKEKLAGQKQALLEQEQAQKESALEAFRTQKALSIVQAGIQTALAVINAIATAPNIIVGLVLAGVAAALGAVQIGVIAAKQPPSFHKGGVLRASDVKGATMDSVPVNMKPGEGALSTSGVAAAGGPEGVDRLNAGLSPAGGETVNIIRFGTRTTEAISHQQLRPRTGRMQQELRGVRPKVGRSIPGRR